MQQDTPIRLTQKQHDAMMQMVKEAYRYLGGKDLNLRANLEWRDRTYYRENDRSEKQMKARWANFLGDATKMQNIVVPVVGPQVEQMVGYLTEVFCTGEPFYGVVAPVEQVNAGVQMESVISDNSRRLGWRAEYVKCFRDGLKYNLMALEKSWESRKVFSVINDFTKAEKDAGKANEEMYAGNFAKRVDLYNIILDNRVLPNKVHSEGEFAGFVELYPRTKLKQLIIDLGSGNTMNVTKAFQTNCKSYIVGAATPGQFYIPLVNPMALLSGSNFAGTDWGAWLAGSTGNKLEYKGLYEVAKLYVRVLPSDFDLDLPAKNTPQIFQLYIVNQQYIIFCKRMTNAHNFIPIVVGQPFDDGLGYQAKSVADNVTPYQEMSSALWAAGIESKRRLVFDRLFYDPSRIAKSDIDVASAVARIPVKPAGYGKPVGDAVFSSNYRDDNIVGVLEMAQRVQQMGQIANGSNNAQQGQFQKGNRTKFEFETVMNRSDWHPRLLAVTLEDSWFAPLKEITKMNVLQYQGPAELYNLQKQQMVTVSPQDLRKSILQFKMTDGQTPSEKLLSLDLLGQVAQLGMAVPAINAEYDVVGMMLYSFKSQGAYWLDNFKRTPEQRQEFLEAQQGVTDAETPTEDKKESAANANAANAQAEQMKNMPMQPPSQGAKK